MIYDHSESFSTFLVLKSFNQFNDIPMFDGLIHGAMVESHVGARPASCTSAQSANGLASRDLETGSLGPWRTHPDVFRTKSDSKNGTIWGGKQWIWVINHYHPLSSIYSCKFDQFEGETNEFWWCPTFFWRLNPQLLWGFNQSSTQSSRRWRCRASDHSHQRFDMWDWIIPKIPTDTIWLWLT